MSFDLFSNNEKPEKIELPGAEIYYSPHIDFGEPEDKILDTLINKTPWKEEEITVYGKTHKQPRLIAWYGDSGKSYSYSKIKLDPLPWTDALFNIKEKVEFICNVKFNSALLNYYRDNNDSIGMHSDDERELGKQPIIASISFGEMRTFILKMKSKDNKKKAKIDLTSGSLLIMKGDTQKNWLHGIEKEREKCGPRVNITFRYVETNT